MHDLTTRTHHPTYQSTHCTVRGRSLLVQTYKGYVHPHIGYRNSASQLIVSPYFPVTIYRRLVERLKTRNGSQLSSAYNIHSMCCAELVYRRYVCT